MSFILSYFTITAFSTEGCFLGCRRPDREADCTNPSKVTDTNEGGRVLDASAHLLSRDLVSQSASESWWLQAWSGPHSCISISLSASPVFVRVGRYSSYVKNAWSYTLTPPYIFIASCFTKHRDNFSFCSYLFRVLGSDIFHFISEPESWQLQIHGQCTVFCIYNVLSLNIGQATGCSEVSVLFLSFSTRIPGLYLWNMLRSPLLSLCMSFDTK
jgi:hypothetical protein